MTEFEDIKTDFNEHYRHANEFWGNFVKDATIYVNAYAGKSFTDDEIREFNKQGRTPTEFNLMKSEIQWYSGYMRDNIKSIIISPVEDSDEKTAEQLTKVQLLTWDKGRIYKTFIDTFDEAIKAGLALTGVYRDYTNDLINGDIRAYKRTYNSFYLDPNFENLDLSDCGYAMLRDIVGKETIKSLLPFVDPKIIDNELPMNVQDDKFLSLNAYKRQWKNRNLVTYDQYYRRTSQKKDFLVDEKSGFLRDISGLDKDQRKKLEQGLKRIREIKTAINAGEIVAQEEVPDVEIRTFEVDKIELNIILNGEPVFSGIDDTKIDDRFPFVPLMCYFEPSIFNSTLRVRGMPSLLYDQQRSFNNRHMKIIGWMDSQISTGFKYLVGSIDDPNILLQAGQSRLIPIDPDNAPQGLGSVEQLAAAPISPGMLEYQSVLDNLGPRILGITDTLKGSDEGGNTQISGNLAQVRTANGLRSNRKIFDNSEYSQKILSELVLKATQNTYPPEKIKRLINEEPTQQFYDKSFESYDAQLKATILTQSQKDLFYFELVNLKKDGLVDIPQSKIIENLPVSAPSEMKEMIEQQEQAAQAQQQKAQEFEDIQKELSNAKIEQDLSLAQERRARVISDLALARERISEASENRADAALKRAKTISEIENLEEDKMQKVLAFVRQLEEQEALDQERIAGQTVNLAQDVFATTDKVKQPQQQASAPDALINQLGDQLQQ